MPDQRFSTESLQQRLQVYHLLSKYYLVGIEGIHEQASLVLQNGVVWENENIALGMKKLNEGLNMNKNEFEEAVFEYNRLFIGPEKTIAHPYESVYRNSNKLLMQKETLAVRRFYRIFGIESKENGSIPDDHLGLELEFMCYILHQAMEQPDNREEFMEHYQEFLRQHVLKWVFEHCEDIIKNSKTSICLAMALLLKGMLEVERMELEFDVVPELQGGENDERQVESI